VFDEDDPRRFYVYPGASTTSTFIEIVYSASPTNITSTSTAIQVDDIYVNAIIDFVLYRAYMKDAEFAGNQQRASGHYNLFLTSVSGGSQIQQALSPNLDAAKAAQPMMVPQPQGVA
jgi:hypothetical protein